MNYVNTNFTVLEQLTFFLICYLVIKYMIPHQIHDPIKHFLTKFYIALIFFLNLKLNYKGNLDVFQS